jgi:small subunit ribosomal protein S16
MVTIRLTRVGAKKRPFFRVVVCEGRTARDGSFVESLGFYNPRTSPETLNIDFERLNYWLGQGAQPSDTLRTLVDRHKAAIAAAPPATAAASGVAAS